ncbi:uncharacterized protein I303_108599 [Kwoniella dejecticola CBS 10117]|uniref:Uncharacterized protein n=1 Tax=Kwoniella dejecticola CBS 10117 TaxID=1296121 RepID=A0A1A5ZWY3_9TREE|nr:uncharacterized protein I303_07076 [Kwoniella dejecticola CBS 10117]OBR82317.1 hypothetical protein I303_07076 [Kwoniella dejecticola CBS 10117]
MSSPSTPGPSTLRARSNRPPSLQNIESNHDTNECTSPSQRGSPGPSSSRTQQQEHDDPRSDDTNTASASVAGSNVQFPGGLYLPAVKWTIGGIESPRRHMRSTPSISTSRYDSSDSPMTSSTIQPRKTQEDDSQETQSPPPPPPASRAVFRSNPTIKSCLSGLKMDRADEIARLFGV